MSTPDGRLAAVPEAVGAPGARPAIETHGLTKRYPRVTALSDCTISVPEGRISALVGPNGAGKTTLLRMLAGLARPTGGTAAVLGGAPRQDPAFLAQIGYLAQEIPLYRRLSAQDHIRAGAHLNPRWDGAGDLTVLLSSHVIADVERVCDHMVLVTASRVQLCGDIDELLAIHKLLVGPRKDTSVLERTHTVVQATRTDRQSTMLVRLGGPALDPAYEASDVSLEDLVLGYLGANAAPGHAHLTTVGEDS